MWIVRLALRRPFTVAVLSLLIMIFGGLSAERMKVDIFPAIDIPVVIVVWAYPGLSAEDMERRIVFLSERAYSTTVDGIEHIDSQSISGIGILKIYFDPGADIGAAIAQIASVSQTASRSMPPGITPPNVIRYNASNVPVAQLTVSSDTLNEQQLFDYGLNFIRIRLFTIEGMSIPAPYGGKSREIMVDVDPAACAAKGLSPQDVVNTLLNGNVLVPAGTAQLGDLEYDVTLNSSPQTVEQFNKLPVTVVNGQPVYLGDVAHVHDGFAVQTNIVHVNGKRATYLALLKHSNASTLAVVDATREMLPSIQATAPQGMQLKIDFDQSVFVRAAVKNVLREAIISSILVSLMVLFFLGSWRSVLIVSTSIPLAILVGVAGLFLLGQTFNLMTLGGLALAIGMLVDDATVEVENIHRNRHLGKKLTVAILDGAHQIAVPALAATLTICIVFFPVVMLVGPAKYLFTPLALSVVISMLASYLLSRTLVPTLARLLMEHESLEQPDNWWGRFNNRRDQAFHSFQEKYYGGWLHRVLAHRGFVVTCAGLLVAVTMALPFVIGFDFFPTIDAGLMKLHYRAPIGTRIDATEELVAQVEEQIRKIIPADELETINDAIGIPISYNLAFVSTDNIGGFDADITIALKKNHRPTEGYVKRIRAEVAPQFPGSSLYFQPADIVSQVLNFGLAAPVDVQIEGQDLEKSYALAQRLRDKMRAIPGTVDVRIAQVLDHPSLAVDVDRARAAQVGLTQKDVANNLLTTLSSSALVSPSFWLSPQNNVNYIVAVQTPLRQLTNTADLMSTPVIGGSTQIRQDAPRTFTDVGEAPYLGSIASLRPSADKALINHATVQRVIDVQCSVEGRDLGGVAKDINRAIRALGDPKNFQPGTRFHVRGQSESMFTSFNALGLGLILAIALVYLLMVVLFQSWVDPLIILGAVPGALAGILWMLALTGTTLNVESFMGSIMAVGIAVSNSILLVNFANDVRVENGWNAMQGAFAAGKTRLRPVLMTAIAMIIGMAPMALALGEGGEQNAPLGRAVIGGLVVATFVTLFVVPVLYTLLRKKPPSAHELDEQFKAESAGASSESMA